MQEEEKRLSQYREEQYRKAIADDTLLSRIDMHSLLELSESYLAEKCWVVLMREEPGEKSSIMAQARGQGLNRFIEWVQTRKEEISRIMAERIE